MPFKGLKIASWVATAAVAGVYAPAISHAEAPAVSAASIAATKGGVEARRGAV